MILIQLVLILGFCMFLLKFLSNPSSHQMRAWKKIAGILFIAMAVVTIVFPDILNEVASIFGVGRGADLLLYALTLVFVFVTFNIYINSKQEQRRIVILARKVALLEASSSKKDKKVKNSDKKGAK